MKYAFIWAHRGEFAVEKMCRILKVGRGRYYGYLNTPKGKREQENEGLLAQIRRIHDDMDKTYGSPRIHEQLRAEGIVCGENRVAKLMSRNGIQAKTRRAFKVTTHSKHNYPVSPNLLKRDFTATKPNQVWVSDITYIRTQEGWLYLAVILDLHHRGIVGYSMSNRLTADIICRALNQAAGRRRPPKDLIFHSDRGSQYACHDFRNLLRFYGMKSSMSRKGDCWDNAVAESFFRSLKVERVYWHKYWTRDEARLDVFDYIERFYNGIRRHSHLGYLSPREFEQRVELQNAA